MTWEELYLDFSDKVHHYILLMVGNEVLAEDLTHDVFIKVQRALGDFRGDSSYYSWIITIARNVVYDHWRRKKIVQFISFTSDREVDANTPEIILEKNEEILELYKIIKKLKVQYQEVIILRKIQELSISATAEALGCSTSRVKTITFRAMNALRAELRKNLHGGEDIGPQL
ncbi:hypothetical protein GCM10008967_28660 [Bacillus carboniphilus]|uniref:Uncharacterized protein n=1 Tax=Bacillus carboniphilus TaxID=86663 RepID=A0ABP3G777_9BACI